MNKVSYAYVLIAVLYMFYGVATFDCNKPPNSLRKSCQPEAFIVSLYEGIIWPLAITYNLTHD